jgi:hypothetical protein
MTIDAIQNLKVSISEDKIKEIAVSFLLKAFDWKLSYSIDDGKVMETVEYCGSHCWTDKEFRRDATEEDRLIDQLIKKINP